MVGAPFDDKLVEDFGSVYVFNRADSTSVLSLNFSGINTVYRVGETLKVDLVTTGNQANASPLDLWVAIQLPDNTLLFITPQPNEPFCGTIWHWGRASLYIVMGRPTHHCYKFQLFGGFSFADQRSALALPTLHNLLFFQVLKYLCLRESASLREREYSN
ncbi:hypothetical protein PN36_33815 [Candidatus Thiomargarita nelsonii]|uniref:Uncharacterized protein n=1 Tax=Candidatus Thiomargarita nelsonii TaxID=1003181 RepID=A0A4E0QUZ5_9GAMM|nr:hypothetical protein PN36_33815 [Candidatus Thiomargarita nelsonii]